MKLDVSDGLYDSSSSVSSDSAASQSSRISHDFLANIGSSYAPSGNLVSPLEGLHSGVPTRTTPTLTPTTLRTIEQTFLDFTNEPASHSREAGFVPPLIEPSQPTPTQTQNNAIQHQQQQQQPQHNNVLLEVQQQQQPQQQQQQVQQTQIQSQQPAAAAATTRRNMGGRRPTRTVGMSPEEEERRQIRRERNKMAAARCRKRRMDHTNALLEETEGLEQKKQNLKDEIQELQQMKMDLELMLESHRTVCRLHSSSPPDVKPVIVLNNKAPTTNGNATDLHPDEFHTDYSCNKQQQQQQQHQHQQQHQEHHNNLNNGLRPNRPNSLPVGFDNNNQQRPTSLPIFTEPKPRPSSLQFKTLETPAFMKTAAEVAGIPITTPSSGIPFNFDSLMEGGTGLTPVSTPLVPSCSSQQRNNGSNSNGAGHHHHLSAVDLSSPDANPPKLVSL